MGWRAGGARLSVVELRGICPLLLILLVILHAFQSLAGEVFKHNVIIASRDTRWGLGGVQGETPPAPPSCPSLPSELNLYHSTMLQQLRGPQNPPSLANSLGFQSLINTCLMHPIKSPQALQQVQLYQGHWHLPHSGGTADWQGVAEWVKYPKTSQTYQQPRERWQQPPIPPTRSRRPLTAVSPVFWKAMQGRVKEERRESVTAHVMHYR